jgi:hypothetical protein
MIAIELTAAIDASGTLATLYVADDRLVTGSADTPGHVAFEPRLMDAGSLGRHVYSDGRTGGQTKLETGEIVIANQDGALDAWLNYSFDGRAVAIRSGSAGTAYPSAWTTLLTGTADGIEASEDKIIIRLRDKSYRLDVPVSNATYAGTNSLPAGLEGTANDIKGQKKPIMLGKVYNIAPPQVNTSRLIYEVGVCNAVDAAYDRGLALTKGADYTSQSDMETNAPLAGNFRAWPAGGYFRLGSLATGMITADCTAGANAAARTTAQTLKALALAAGLTAGEISSADVTALDSANSAVIGLWLRDEDTLAALDLAAASIGAWYGFDGAGTLRMGRLEAPSGSPAATLNDYDVLAIERRPPRDASIPVWKLSLKHSRNHVAQPSDLAGAVTAARRELLAQDYLTETASDAAIKTQWLLASEAEVTGSLTAASDAATEASRQLALIKVRRDVFDVTVPLDAAVSLKLMDVVRVVYPRFGLTSGKDFRVIGIRIELAQQRIVLSLWG